MISRKIIVFVVIFVTYLIPNNLVMAAAAAAPSGEQQWQIELAKDSSVSIGEPDMLTLANASEVIGGMIRIENDIDQSEQLTAENIKAFGENNNYTISAPIDSIQLGDGQFITRRQIKFLIEALGLLTDNNQLIRATQPALFQQFFKSPRSKRLFTEISKNIGQLDRFKRSIPSIRIEAMRRLIKSQSSDQSPVKYVYNMIVLLQMANALDIAVVQEFCINELKIQLTSPSFLRALAGNNNVLSNTGLTQLPAELIELLQNTIVSDKATTSALLNFISRLRPDAWQLQRTLSGHTDSVNSVAFSPDGTMLASASNDRTIRLWNVADGALINTLPDNAWVNSVAFNPKNGTILASASRGGTIKLWDVADGRVINTLVVHSAAVNSVAFSPDGTMLASASADTTIRLWKVSDGTIIQTLSGSGIAWMSSVAFSPDGKMLASASYDSTIRLWNVADGELISTLPGNGIWVNSVAFSPDGRMLASASNDHTIRLWNVENDDLIYTLTGNTAMRSVTFSPNGTMLVAGSNDGNVRLWNVADGALIHTLPGHTGIVDDVAFSPNGTMLASASYDDTVKLWRPVVDFSQLTLDQMLLLFARAHNISGFTAEQQGVLDSAIQQLRSAR